MNMRERAGASRSCGARGRSCSCSPSSARSSRPSTCGAGAHVAAEPQSGGRVVAVLGYSRRRDRRLNPVCAERLAYAERQADGARAVASRAGHAVGRQGPSQSSCATRGAVRAFRSSAIQTPARPPETRQTSRRSRRPSGPRSSSSSRRAGTGDWLAPLTAALRGRGIRLTVEGSPGRRRSLTLARELGCLALLPLQVLRARRRETPW